MPRFFSALFVGFIIAFQAMAQDVAPPGKNTALPPPLPGDEPETAETNQPVKEITVNDSTDTERKGETAYTGVQNPRHRECILRIQENVDVGREAAEQWVRDGGGPFASHCLAVADLAAGFPRLAAIRLQNLAEQNNAGDALTRARLYAQASEIMLSDNRLAPAADALASAFQLAPEAGELYLLAAKINHAKEKWQAVIDAVTKAEEAGFFTSTGYANRGRAYKELTQFDPSAEDVARALRIDPFNLDALVLRGELAQTGIIINTNISRIPSSSVKTEGVTLQQNAQPLQPTGLSTIPSAVKPGEIDLSQPSPPSEPN